MFRISKDFDTSLKLYMELSGDTKNTRVVDIVGKRQDKLNKLAKERIKTIAIEQGKVTSRIFIANSSVAKIKGLASEAKDSAAAFPKVHFPRAPT